MACEGPVKRQNEGSGLCHSFRVMSLLGCENPSPLKAQVSRMQRTEKPGAWSL